MCYSALVDQNLKKMARQAQARVDWDGFADLFARRAAGEEIRLAKALEFNFQTPETELERTIAHDIRVYQERLAAKWETELFRQKKRLADAERKLTTRRTQKAEEDSRIAARKIEWLVGKLSGLRRASLKPGDGRIFPFWYAPVLIERDGERVILPMRYHLRMSGKPESTDKRYPGLYNARRDNLERYWRTLFGAHHAICFIDSFYENVALHEFERREKRPGEADQNIVLHFNPQPASTMHVACLWDRWEGEGGRSLYSFAAITDEPPAEVAATGHNRCIIPVTQADIGAWLAPGAPLADYHALMDRRDRPYYAHELAA